MEKVEIKKNKEDWDIVTKKISFDSSYRFNVAWWIMFWIFCGLCLTFLIYGIVVFAGSMQGWTKETLQGATLGCGFGIILVFALFWITNNFVNAKMYMKAEYPDHAKQLIKKQAIWMNVFRISTAVLCLVCGLMFVVSGFMWNSLGTDGVSESTIRIINGCACLIFAILTGLSITGYYFVIVYKRKTLDVLVPRNSSNVETKK